MLTATQAGPNDTLCLRAEAVVPEFLGALQFGGRRIGYVYRIDLSGHDRTEPQPLTWNGAMLLHIGGGASIEINEADPVAAVVGNEDVTVVFGGIAQLRLSNALQAAAHEAWRVNGLDHLFELQEVNPNSVQLTIADEDMGKIIRVTCAGAATRLVFLPQDLRQVDQDAAAQMNNGWCWTPTEDPYRVTEAAKKGLCRGNLSRQNLDLNRMALR